MMIYWKTCPHGDKTIRKGIIPAKNHSGFLLVEILIAVAVFTAFIGFTSYLFSQTAHIVQKNTQLNNQTYDAQNILDSQLSGKAITNHPNLIKIPITHNLTKTIYVIDQKHRIELISYYEN
jgi:type II secretory pathway pseudopilin PulG